MLSPAFTYSLLRW